MSKAKMEEARELIRAARYDEARDILETVDHPLAKDWLQKLEKIDPDTQDDNSYDEEISETEPYESGENSPWMQSVKSAQTGLDDVHREEYEAHIEKVEAQIAKSQRNELLMILFYPFAIVAFFALVIVIGVQGQNGNWRPLFYGLGFMALGLPLRLIFRLGRDGEYRPGIIASMILLIITLIVFVIAGYGLFLGDEHIYRIVLNGAYISDYLQSRFAIIKVDGLLLFLYALVGVALIVFPTDAELIRFIQAMMRGRSRRYYIR